MLFKSAPRFWEKTPFSQSPIRALVDRLIHRVAQLAHEVHALAVLRGVGDGRDMAMRVAAEADADPLAPQPIGEFGKSLGACLHLQRVYFC